MGFDADTGLGLRAGFQSHSAMRYIAPPPQPPEMRRMESHGYPYSAAYLPQVRIIDHQFQIPQLIKTRRIAALLPHDYDQTDRRYPVLYLQDGQNLFGPHAPYGSWEVTAKLAGLAERGLGDLIVISIDHAEHERVAEFTPTRPTRLGVGEGRKYADFLAETLKPWVDRHFRTLPEREHTGIGGSSMGGLISLYAAMQHPLVYSKLMIFSPSFWVVPELAAEFVREVPQYYGCIYIYGGTEEGEELVHHVRDFHDVIRSNPHGRNLPVKLVLQEGAHHNEAAWGRAFPPAIEWLFFRDSL